MKCFFKFKRGNRVRTPKLKLAFIAQSFRDSDGTPAYNVRYSGVNNKTELFREADLVRFPLSF